MDIFKAEIFGVERKGGEIIIYRYGDLPMTIDIMRIQWNLISANHEHDEEFIITSEIIDGKEVHIISGYAHEIEAFADKIGITTSVFPT